ncbi:MAG: PD40 domain-containing protein [Holophagaceae bacterium]|uniref:Tricorn protease homolog n=1 Tax=Candidatus Geothrix skivensis TaxID=2954439 RepID=A0A9D7SFZ6_9BACT|nr:PD40 domain-containing protein [Candidatus Geothrix skivensis]
MPGHTLFLRCLALALLLCGAAQAQTKLLRFPALHGDKVAFTHGGDLWTAPAAGGTATRLTAHPGLELFARFSPDGKWIAFTGQYDGDEQVYVMPSGGGIPRQLTFDPAAGPLPPRGGYDHQVVGWTPDGLSVVFRAASDADGVLSRTALYTVALNGGLPKKLPMPTAGPGSFSSDGKRIAYTPMFRDFRHWKRYEGGWAQELFVFDLATNQQKKIASSKRTERDPMWIGDKVYFASDRDGTLNLYSVDPATDTVKQLTTQKTWDVRWPSSDQRSRIVYELNGELRIFNVQDGSDRGLAITVPTDGGASRPARISVEKNIEGYALSPKGERALFVARGDVFTAPIEKGPTRNLTNSSGAHDRHARWSPDGRKIAFISDLSGEDQVYLIDQEGKGRPEALTSGLVGQLNAPVWAPGGKHLAFTHKDGIVYVVGVADRKLIRAFKDEFVRVGDLAWSPDGQFLAFSAGNKNNHRSLLIWSLADQQVHRMTGDLFPVTDPAWDPEGKVLYALSRRDYAPQISNLEFDFAGNRNVDVIAYTLRKDVPHPFPPESDEVNAAPEKKEEGEKKADKPAEAAKAPAAIRIDWEGFEQRGVRVPLPADNLGGLEAIKGFLLYSKNGPFVYGEANGRRNAGGGLWIFDLKKRQESELLTEVQGWTLSQDGTKVLARAGQGPAATFQLIEAKPKGAEKKAVSTKELFVDRIPAEEWREVYDETWRRFRDFFYVKNMHGYDWKALREQYRPWLQHVTHRSDLTYVLTELISELNIGHTYTEGGDFILPERAKMGLPGARFELDAAAGRYRLARIYRGHNEEPKYRSPLTEPGVDAREGDYILAIDGVELKGEGNPYQLLRNKTFTVTLTLNAKPTFEGARQATYRPIESDASLRYLDFVLRSRENVDKLSGGKVGYLHIPDMGAPGLYEFIKWYYPQIRKEGLVVDVRANGGGNISQMILARLGRKLLGTRFGNDGDHPSTYPGTVFHGHLVALTSETSASDGDIFPHYFRAAGLGPLIGKRTWGGVVGGGNSGLIDGGSVFVPRSGTNAATGEWVIEGEGVSPDIEVENDPASMLAGRDPQLERGVQEVLKRIAEKPLALPKRPADPVKTK